ncbi:Macrolide export ATP-binding/permease protein MacB [Slackia heliotrinireducens]|uniref:ABC-type antimicrobial peptide transport system, ATPase component n=1 Tax=Slackia heliotrinireducens (strain ATCC 29202 / DSM 20476 / NCTC 11029 / RHS 1) TaxID=471855 RepID=C7N1S1_SLAHD|nr:ABC transporter ATP-binding protein/permease [Slackia heliotrinireducens]ACV23362.1 ABC-type antimicrobial peptide transport system, ATPase component [Slackia heliotrinireducens DSM 20476]VEH02614.1 Macrolide export ATP-binding/permease protein MacB [Slackia heliotrinireducens]
MTAPVGYFGCKGLTKRFRSGSCPVVALDDVTLAFALGTLTAVTGPSGCGKTTLLSVLVGLDRSFEGAVVVNGTEVTCDDAFDWDAYRRRVSGMVFQDFNLIDHLTAVENVEAALRLAGFGQTDEALHRQALSALDRAGVADVADRLPYELSGGQQQRVAVARTLARNPQVILADEPTGSLDADSADAIMGLLREAADRGSVVVVVTHDEHIAETYADTVVRLDEGRVVACEHRKDVQTRTAEPSNVAGGLSFPSSIWLAKRRMVACKRRIVRTALACMIGFLGLGLFGNLLLGSVDYLRDLEQGIIMAYPLTVSDSAFAAAENAALDSVSDADAADAESIGVDGMLESAVDAANGVSGVPGMSRFLSYFQVSSANADVDLMGVVRDYGVTPLIYRRDVTGAFIQVNPSSLATRLGAADGSDEAAADLFGTADMWSPLIWNGGDRAEPYEVLAGRMPAAYDEIVLVTSANGTVSDYVLYAAGLEDAALLTDGEVFTGIDRMAYDDVLGVTFCAFAGSDAYDFDGNVWQDRSADAAYMESKQNDATVLTVVGVVRPASESDSVYVAGGFGYLQELEVQLIDRAWDSDIAHDQQARYDTDVFTGEAFGGQTVEGAAAAMMEGVRIDRLSEAQLACVESLTDAQVSALREEYPDQFDDQGALDLTDAQWDRLADVSDSDFEQGIAEALDAAASSGYRANMAAIGAVDRSSPDSVAYYPDGLRPMEQSIEIIDRYNSQFCEDTWVPMSYADTALTLIRRRLLRLAALFACVGAVAVLVISSMVSSSTRDAAIERTHELAVLRSLGASPRHVEGLLVIESAAIGLVSAVVGVLVANLLVAPMNGLFATVISISNLMRWSLPGSVLMVLVGMALTVLVAWRTARRFRSIDLVSALKGARR